ncbi:MAG: hypothetical protein HLUCCX21_06165 [Porphyrobacter sp. HL-46]|nr:MAG: hypothetical protein HLUCCX21_06165 [Porphyrobacter sp. HL-46]
MDFDIVMLLALFTIGAVLVFGVWSLTRAKKAQDRGEGTAAEGRNPFHSEKTGPEHRKNPPMPPRN